MPAEALTVALTPIQDLHGYEHPWAGGNGKNKLKITATTLTTNGVTFTVNEDGSVTVNGTTTADNTFFNLNYTSNTVTIPFGVSVEIGAKVISPNGNLNIQVAASADGVVKNVGAVATFVKGLPFTIEQGSNTASWMRFQIQYAGTTINNVTIFPFWCYASDTLTAWEPYENECPISGRTGTTVSTRNADNTETASATISFGQTVYGGQVDFKTGNVTVEWGYIASYNGETLPGAWISDRDVYAAGATPTTDAEVCYELATPTTLSLTPDILTMLKNNNSVSGDGVITITALTGDSWS